MISSREPSLVISASFQKSFSTTSCGVDKTTHSTVTKAGIIDVDNIGNKVWVPTLGPLCFIYETLTYGKTVVAGELISKGTKIYKCVGEIIEHPTMNTVELDEDKHINCTQGTCEITCHNCSPNSSFQLEDDFLVLVALKDIEKGEQITFNYCTTEWNMSSPFKCLCGNENCFGYIAGFYNLPKNRRAELIPMLLPAIKKRALREGLIKE